jgi:hypothetical protein
MTYDGSGTVHFYINGADAGFGSESQSPFTLYTYDINSYVVGGTGTNTDGETTMNGSFNGLMAGVEIYATALTPGQIGALYNATYPTEAEPAGLTLHFEIDHNGQSGNSGPYSLLFPELSANSNFEGPPGTGYFVSSYTSACTAQINPDGTTSFNGAYFPDYDSLITEFTNTWTLEVTNNAFTNFYTFYGTYFCSNDLPLVAVTFPEDGSTDVTNQPTFTWEGTTNLDTLYVQVTDTNNLAQYAYLPITQTSWLCPVVLSNGDNCNFFLDYNSNADATILATTPLNSLSQPIPGWVSTCTLYSFGYSAFTVANFPPPAPGTWTITGGMTTARALHTLTLLNNGLVLASAGEGTDYFPVSTAELYNPALGRWAGTGSLNTDRYGHTANLLANGKVLVAGGIQSFGAFGNTASTELYNPVTGTWATNNPMTTSRYGHTATLLGNGTVLAAGGQAHDSNGYSTLASAELYNPTNGTWTTTGLMSNARLFHTATLLTNGWVLVAGGEDTNGTPLASAELYNPVAGLWTTTGSMTTARTAHAATLLPGGKVLVAGGDNTQYNPQNSAELYDPVMGTWAATGSLMTSRAGAAAMLLNNGLVLVTGGVGNPPGILSSAELYNPATEMWTAAATMHSQREDFPAILLPNGQVLAAGGFFGGSLTNAELYGSTVAGLAPIILTGEILLPGGAFQFGFTNTPGMSFTALAATNLSLPLSNWSVLGSVPEISPGVYQFTDPSAANSRFRFYTVSSP